MARDHGVTIVVKQHGGETGHRGGLCRDRPRGRRRGIKVNYDAGNVMDYLDVDPSRLRACAEEVRSFCIKDHRNFPKDEDCGPGFGEIDHYKLLDLVAFTGRDMPLCCEKSSPRPFHVRRSRKASIGWLGVREFLRSSPKDCRHELRRSLEPLQKRACWGGSATRLS